MLASHLEQRIGRRERMLVERSGTGRTEHYLVLETGGDPVPGSIVEAVVDARRGERMLGTLVR